MRFPLLLLPALVSVQRAFAQSSSADTSGSAPSATASPDPEGSASSQPTEGPNQTDFTPTATIENSGSATPVDTSLVVAVSTDAASSSFGSASSTPTSSAAAAAGGPPSGSLPPPPATSVSYTYPQPALPSVTATRNPNAWTMSPDFEITDVPTTREYTFDIAPAAAAPDGYMRQIYAVNNQFPGPLIEANEGDEIIIHMNNYLDIGMAVHWHGLYQNGTAYMDGVPGVSQCPIPPGGSFTYRFKIQNQYGSYWWHSHFGNTLADGIVGGLVVHSTRDPIKRGVDFDEEIVVMVQDWMDIQSETIVEALHTDAGFEGSIAPPQGNAVLVNGVGRTNCSNPVIQDHSLKCESPAPPEIPVPAGKKVKLRVLNTGSFGMFRVTVDEHPFELVEVDDTPVWGPSGMHEVAVTTGQRASFIINTDQGDVGSAFYFRANFVTACVGPAGLTQTGLGIIRYVDADGNSPNYDWPNTQAWDDLEGGAALCSDIDEEYDLKPRVVQDAPTEILQTHVMSSALGRFVDKDGNNIGTFGFNNITYQNQVGYPLISQIQDGHDIDGKYVAHATFKEMGGGDIIINNLDGGISHPFHLHGKPFMIVARGSGNLTKEQWEGMRDYTAQTSNPLRRDVLEITGRSYAVLRLYIDLPGVWPLHCHIGWHLSEGKLAAFVYLPDKVRQLPQPEDWKGMCSHWGHDELGPARRGLTGFEADLRGQSKRTKVYAGPTSKRRRLNRSGPRDQ